MYFNYPRRGISYSMQKLSSFDLSEYATLMFKYKDEDGVIHELTIDFSREGIDRWQLLPGLSITRWRYVGLFNKIHCKYRAENNESILSFVDVRKRKDLDGKVVYMATAKSASHIFIPHITTQMV